MPPKYSSTSPAKPPPKPPGLLPGLAHTVSGIGTTVAHVTHAPPPPSLASTLSRAPSIASSSVHQAVHAATTPHKAVVPRGDVQSSGSRYPGTNKGQDVTAYKKSAAYKAAVAETFLHQSLPQQGAILRGIMSQPNAYKTIEGSTVLKALHSLGVDHATALGHYLPHGTGIGALSDLGKIFSLKNVEGATGTSKTATPGFGGLIGSASPFQTGTYGKSLVVNSLKDAIDLPAQTITTLGQLGGDVIAGKPGKLVSDVISPFEHLSPKSALAHPLDTYLMLAGPLHGATRVAAGAVRAAAPDSALGQALATPREGIALSGQLTHERPHGSPYPLIQAGQRVGEKIRYERSPTGALRPRSADLRKKLTALETSRIVGINERVRRANRDAAVSQRVEAVRPSRPVRVAHQAKAALKRGEQPALIPGAAVLARIADGTIRRPDTVAADLEKHIQQVSAMRANLLENKDLLKEHDAYVAQLRSALKDKAFLRNPAPAFAAAEKYAHDYAPVEGEAHRLGHFGADMTKEGLQRRVVMHYAQSHMGASFDEEHGLVNRHGRQLATETVLRHMRGPEGVNGRKLAFTSDRAAAGSAYYRASERRPLPQTARNTLFAYTHGLTEPSHEALLHQHVRMQGIVDAHKAMNRMLDAIAIQKPGGGYFRTYTEAAREAKRHGDQYKPINVAEIFHPLGALEKAMEGTDPALFEQEALLRSLDTSAAVKEGGEGRWLLADRAALRRIEEHKAQISPNVALRAFRGLNNQFRQVALGTSAKHIPGVIQEGLIRDIAAGVGLSSWITGKRIVGRAREIRPEEGALARTELTGGTVSGATKMAITHQTSAHFEGTSLARPLRAFESFMKTPGPRQLRSAWHAWIRFAINGTKKYIEEQNQVAGIGKAALRDFGSEHGPFFKALRLQGRMLDDAAHGLYDPVKRRQFRAEVERIYGRWTDLTPTGQTAMMFSPFGLWWVNSVKWLLRQPIDAPVKTGIVAAATVGTEKRRMAQGLDLFAPNHLPLYEQGGIPSGGNIIAQNYYSPFGVANDPLETAQSLIGPWYASIATAAAGKNWLFKPLTSPSDPRGLKDANPGARAQVILGSMLSSFVPLYTKAQTIAAGGESTYDVSPNFPLPAPKKPGSFGAGLKKAFTPIRVYRKVSGSPTSSSSNPWHGSASTSNPWRSGASSNPWR